MTGDKTQIEQNSHPERTSKEHSEQTPWNLNKEKETRYFSIERYRKNGGYYLWKSRKAKGKKGMGFICTSSRRRFANQQRIGPISSQSASCPSPDPDQVAEAVVVEKQGWCFQLHQWRSVGSSFSWILDIGRRFFIVLFVYRSYGRRSSELWINSRKGRDYGDMFEWHRTRPAKVFDHILLESFAETWCFRGVTP